MCDIDMKWQNEFYFFRYREALAEKVPCLGIELDQPKKKAEG